MPAHRLRAIASARATSDLADWVRFHVCRCSKLLTPEASGDADLDVLDRLLRHEDVDDGLERLMHRKHRSGERSQWISRGPGLKGFRLAYRNLLACGASEWRAHLFGRVRRRSSCHFLPARHAMRAACGLSARFENPGMTRPSIIQQLLCRRAELTNGVAPVREGTAKVPQVWGSQLRPASSEPRAVESAYRESERGLSVGTWVAGGAGGTIVPTAVVFNTTKEYLIPHVPTAGFC